LTDGRFTIKVPEEFRLVSEQEGLTVQLTPRANANVWVESLNLNQIVARGTGDVEFDYFVNGVRRGFADFESVRTNKSLVPLWRGRPFGAGLPQVVRDMLIENGTLNEDYTPNETTANSLGWTLRERPEPTRDLALRTQATAQTEREPAAPRTERRPQPVRYRGDKRAGWSEER